MKPDDFEFYKKMLMEKSGLALTPEKTYLLTSRLTPLAQSLGFDSLDNLTAAIRAPLPDPKVVKFVVEAMTTNETLFFRDNKPFTQLKDSILPHLIEKRAAKKSLRIWSAASSTGQESYSIAMTISEFLVTKPGWKVEIVGTDISEAALDQARRGEYNQFEIQRGLPIQMIVKYFTQNGTSWKVKDNLREMTKFQYFNLLHPMDILGSFDLIFCRNVLIYFNAETKTRVLNSMSARMVSDGFLFLGACETAMGLQTNLESVPNFTGLHTLKTMANPFAVAKPASVISTAAIHTGSQSR